MAGFGELHLARFESCNSCAELPDLASVSGLPLIPVSKDIDDNVKRECAESGRKLG
jgi:hypothetical protein